jgi:rhomboid domain-containing protein 1
MRARLVTHAHRMLPMVWFVYRLLRTGVHNVPPVTLTAIAAMTAVYYGYVPSLNAVDKTGVCVCAVCACVRCVDAQCLHAQRVYYEYEWWRLFASVFMHAAHNHFYYNMLSLLWKVRVRSCVHVCAHRAHDSSNT